MERPDTRHMWEANARAWIELSRAGFDVYRDLVNTPAFFELLLPVAGLVVWTSVAERATTLAWSRTLARPSPPWTSR